MSLRIGVIGSGQVAQVLARGFAAEGHTVRIGTRDAGKLAEFAQSSGVSVGAVAEVASEAEVVILAVKGTAAEPVVAALASELAGKVVIDATNPIADVPPEDGVLVYFTQANESLMERLQVLAPEARFVKAFNSVGNHLFIHPQLQGGRPTMFICGNDAGAKAQVRGLLDQVGWAVEDVGTVKGARALEPLCQLWCATGFLHKTWGHAFAYLRG